MSNQERWNAIDDFFWERLGDNNATFDAVLAASREAGLPPIAVAPNQGKFLRLLAGIRGAKRILEVGTLGGYSTIWLAGALPPDGQVISIEADPHHAEVAQRNIAQAGFAGIVEIRQGEGLNELPKLAGQTFDFVFIDADKQHNLDYFEWALKLTAPDSIVIVDNVVRDGSVLDAQSDDPSVLGTQRFADALRGDTRVDATMLQTVGSKGWDGFVLAVVK